MKKFALILFVSLALANCSDDSTSDIDNSSVTSNTENNADVDTDSSSDDNTNQQQTRLTYTNNIKTIIDNNCLECHSSPVRNGAPFSLTTFNQVSNRAGRMQVRMNSVSNPMPQRGLIASDLRAMFDQWITDGKLQ
ncbi:hypothetical protein ACXGQW_07380 [Wenyingzhuangia sp. IMCC45533]